MINALSKILGRKRSGTSDSGNGAVPSPPKAKESIWQKATSLRQSLRHPSRSKVSQKSGTTNDYSFHLLPQKNSPNSSKKEWGSQKNLARERRSIAIAPKHSSERTESRRSLHARSLCVVSGDNWDFDAMVKSTPEGMNLSEVGNATTGYHVELPRHLRSSRKLTKDSGYETSAQGDPDYINTLSDWLSVEKSLENVSEKNNLPPDKTTDSCQIEVSKSPSKTNKKLEWNSRQRPLSFSHQEVPVERKNRQLRHSYSQREVAASPHYENHRIRQPSVDSLRCHSSNLKPESRYSSVESVAKPAKGHLTKSTPHLANVKNSRSSSFSTTNLHSGEGESANNMVTRKFKKGSVYDALASTSGLDFSPVVQLKTYNPRREDLPINPTVVSKTPNKPWGDSPSKRSSSELSKSTCVDSNAHSIPRSSPNNSYSSIEEKNSSPKTPKAYQQAMQQIPTTDPYNCVTSHEKYPSWPVTNVTNQSPQFRSNSWIPQTDYPKEKVGYLRPKKSFKLSTNQLQPVLEKSPDSIASKKSKEPSPNVSFENREPSVEQSQFLSLSCSNPSTSCMNKPFYFDAFHTSCTSPCFGERDYNIHSPPERDTSSTCSTINSESNSFLSKYEDVLRHQAQYSAPLSFWDKQVGNEPTGSAIDTPFLDRLRLDSGGAWPPPPPPPPPPELLLAAPQNDIELSSENGTWMGSMESSSHGRGLPKWQGSYSDLSTMSTQLSNRSSLFDSGHSTMPESGRLSPQSSCGSTAPSLLFEGPTRAQVVARHGYHREIVAHSARVQQPERHGSESILYYASGAPSRPKTALSFNIDDQDGIRSPEPVPGPSGLQFISNSDGNRPQYRSQTSLQFSQSHVNPYKPSEASSSMEANSSNRKSRNSNSVSSEDSSFKVKDISDDTSGSSSDVSNITCISNYRESLSTPKSRDSGSTNQAKPPSLNASNMFSSKSNLSDDVTACQKTTSSEKQQSCTPSAETYKKSNIAPDNEGSHIRTKADNASPKLRINDHHRQRSADNPGKSRSMDEASRKLICTDNEKRQRISEPDLKTIQKQAVFSFYQRMSLAESVRASGQDSSRSPTDQEAPPPYELPSPTRLKLSFPKLSILPNKYVPQEFSDDKSNEGGMSNGRGETSNKNDPQSGLANPFSKSVPNLHSLKTHSVEVSPNQRCINMQQSAQRGSSNQMPMKRGSPLAKDEIIPWDQLPSVLERKREAIEKASLNSESKEPPEDGNNSASSASNYFKGHKSPRKVQLKEVHHSNETASVKVITHDGVTLVQTTGERTNGHHRHSKENEKKSKEEKKSNGHHNHQHYKRRPAPPPPPKQPPKRPPPPPPPESPPPPPPPPQTSPIVVILEESISDAASDVDKELQELRIDERKLEINGGVRRHESMASSSSSPQLLSSYGSDCCSSPELPLPPPPPNTDGHAEVLINEPLPPPPDILDVEITSRTLDSSLVYPKNSYMSYRSEKKLGRQGFEGNYRRSFHTSSSSVDLSTLGNGFHEGGKDSLSPSSWEYVHNIRQHGTTVIFHSDALRYPSKLQRSTSQELPTEEQRLSNGNYQLTTSNAPMSLPLPSQEITCENHVLESPSTNSTSSPSMDPSTNDSIVIQCDASTEDISSLDNCILTDDSFVDSTESESGSLISVDHNQNSPMDNYKCDRTVPTIMNQININDIVIRTNSSTQTTDTPRLKRKVCKTKEELECERLSMDYLHHYGDLKLRNLLVPAANHRTMSDYMEGLLNFELEKGGLPLQRYPEDFVRQNKQNGHHEKDSNASSPDLESKIRPMNHFVDIIENHNFDGEIEAKTMKMELVMSIKRKLEVLRSERIVIREEMQLNEKVGKDLANRVQKLAKSNEVQKYVLHVEEMEKIINLLLSLSARLAKAENILRNIPADASPDEKRILEAKRSKLLEQHEDARRLKESIDRRSNQISGFLHRYFTDEEYADYDYFMKMKTRLIVDTRDIDDKINLGEEQLAALRNSMDANLWKSAKS